MVNLMDKLGQGTLSEESWIKKAQLIGPAWRCTKFVNLFYKRCDYTKNKNAGQTIKSSTVPEKLAVYEFLTLCNFNEIVPERKLNITEIWKQTGKVTTNLMNKKQRAKDHLTSSENPLSEEDYIEEIVGNFFDPTTEEMNLADLEEVERLLGTRTVSTAINDTVSTADDEGVFQDSTIVTAKSGKKIKQVPFNPLCLKNILKVGQDVIAKTDFKQERFLKRLQVEDEQKYYSEMQQYIQAEKDKSRLEQDITNDSVIDNDMITRMDLLSEVLPK